MSDSAAAGSEREAFEKYAKGKLVLMPANATNGRYPDPLTQFAWETWQAARAAAPAAPSAKLDGKFSCDGQGVFNTVSGERIPSDEPLFLLRGRDHHALSAIHHYIEVCASDCNDLHLAALSQTEHKFARFAVEHPERMKEPGKTRHVKLEAPAPLSREEGLTFLLDVRLKAIKNMAHRAWEDRSTIQEICKLIEKRATEALDYLHNGAPVADSGASAPELEPTCPHGKSLFSKYDCLACDQEKDSTPSPTCSKCGWYLEGSECPKCGASAREGNEKCRIM